MKEEHLSTQAVPAISGSDELAQYDSDGSNCPHDAHGARSYRPFNRGNKLKRTLEQPAVIPTKPTLWTVHAIDEEYEFGHVGKRRAILRKGRRRKDEDDPYAGINVDEIWSLPDTPTEAARVSSVAHTLRSRHLKVLSQTAMDMVEKEQEFNRTVSRFAQIIQQDDPLSQDMNLESTVPADVLQGLRDSVQELVSCSNEYVKRVGDMRSKLMVAYTQKKALAKRLMGEGEENGHGSRPAKREHGHWRRGA